jgi:hypothetical protein
MWHARTVELELRRADGDRRLYVVDGVGTIRYTGLLARSATAEGDGRRWEIRPKGLWQTVVEATGSDGAVVGEFHPTTFRGGGTVRWESRELLLRPSGAWRSRYVLEDAGRELATLEGKGWGRRPVAIDAHGEAVLEPGLILFAAFVTRRLAEGTAAAASSSPAAT